MRHSGNPPAAEYPESVGLWASQSDSHSALLVWFSHRSSEAEHTFHKR